ncbi:MAG: type II secretion system inner membrane protein GspF [Hyphomonadaceae bacterium]|nr:type II secretion system inner membrane protein GspF [Hyphomonadaceae bacterium]
METFDYAAFDADGNRLRGSVPANNAREARDILRARRLTPIDLKASKAGAGQSFTLERKASHKDLTQATRQLSILIDAATPVEQSLKIVAVQFDRSAMRQILLDVQAQVLEGARLSDAMGRHSKTFSSLYTGMVASGETSGRLAEVLDRLATDLEAAQKVRRRILAATVYPMVLFVVALVVTTILMIFVVPKVVEQFDTFGQELPGLTRFVIGMSEWMQNYGLIFLIMVLAFMFGFSRALKKPAMRLWWHERLLSLPLVGRLIRDLNAARFARTMAGLIDSGTPALTAMETSRHTLRNRVIYDAVSGAAAKVREGATVSASLRQTGVFPPMVTQMVAGGEASGDIGKMFSKSADYLEGEFDAATSIFLSLLEPLIIIMMSIVVLLIIGAIFMPILQMNTLAL